MRERGGSLEGSMKGKKRMDVGEERAEGDQNNIHTEIRTDESPARFHLL